MMDLSFLDPPVEVAASSPRLEMILSKLRLSGLRLFCASAMPELDAPDTLLVDLASAPPAYKDLAALREVPAGYRQLVFLQADDRFQRCPTGAICLPRDEDIVGLRARLMAEARRLARQREARIRLESVRELSAEPAKPAAQVPHLLYLGDWSARFLALQKSLQARGINLTAALSCETARQHMAGRRFTAALAGIDTCEAGAARLAAWITGEEGLRGLPLILTATPGPGISAPHAALLGQASAILDAEDSEAGLPDAIAAECRRLDAGAPMMPRPGITIAVTDTVSGLFNRHFFEVHLPRQMQVAAAQAQPLSVLTLSLDAADTRSAPAQQLMGEVLARQTRETDCAALIQTGVFAVSLPATAYRGGVRLAERIGDGLSRAGESPGFSWRVTERRSYHTAHTLLTDSLIGPFVRTRIAA
jgi:GGDEF domain-containing protein